MNNIFLFEAFNSQEIFKKGINFTNKIKATDANKPKYKHMPCYQYVYLFMKEFLPNLNPAIMNMFKMGYHKDIGTLPRQEGLKLAQQSLMVPSKPDTMRGLEYVNSKYNIGNIVSVDQAKIGDAISFWVYDLIQFSHVEKNFSFPETEAKFNQWIKNNKLDVNKVPEWLIEGAVLKWGHYAIISDIDSNYLYLSSSGEGGGVNGIWNGVSRQECTDNVSRVLKADLKTFQNMSYDKLIFQTTDKLCGGRSIVPMRSYILNFIK